MSTFIALSEAGRDAAVEEFLDAVSTYDDDAEPTEGDFERWAAIATTLMDMRVRDSIIWHLCTRYSDDEMDDVVAFLSRLSDASCDRDSEAPAITLMAIGAWLIGGHDEFVNRALDAVAEIDPEYTLAELMSLSVASGLPAQEWRQMMADMPFRQVRHGNDRVSA